MIFVALLCAACCGAAQGARARSLEEKLGGATDYLPKAATPVERLVEVAQRFKLPMAVEWVERAGTIKHDSVLPARKRSLKELLNEIVSISPEHRVEIEGGLVHVYSPLAVAHPFNFLNIRLKSYYVKDDDLFAAEDQLRWAIRFTLEPEKYRDGYAGGYGHGSGDVFEIPRFSISVSDMTIREVLNRIAQEQGNALWVATIRSEDLEGPDPYWKRKGTDGEYRPVNSGWHFLPLSGIAELAKEQVAVDVLIEGLLDKRMSTIPVMLEDGLTTNSEGATGGSSSDGNSYFYSARVEKMGKDFLMLSVQLRVRRSGGQERRFDSRMRVVRGEVTELQPETGVSVRAYLEPRDEATDEHE
jgi:hypothetical protein